MTISAGVSERPVSSPLVSLVSGRISLGQTEALSTNPRSIATQHRQALCLRLAYDIYPLSYARSTASQRTVMSTELDDF
jgi:hypothetical protein